MDDETFTSDTAAMNRHRLLEQLAIIRSLFRKESSADDDAAAVAARNHNVVKGRAKEGVRLINDQMASVSTELLLTVMSDMMLLRLLDGLGLEEGRAVPSSDMASDQQLMLMDAATYEKKKKRASAVAKAKKKRYKQNKAAAKHKKTKLMSWLGRGRPSGGLISLIMMIAFGSITMLIFPLSLIHPSDGSGEGESPPALPPSASKSLRQKDHQSNDGESVSSNMDIISPLPAVAVVPPSIFSPTFVGNRRMKSDEIRASTCVNTPGWTDHYGNDCQRYIDMNYGCPISFSGIIGHITEHCCYCGGGSHTCEDIRPKCHKYINFEGIGIKDGVMSPLCTKAESLCCEGEDDFQIEILTLHDASTKNQTVGLYNECKCDFWSRLCEDTPGAGEACDYAAEYCCGDVRWYATSAGGGSLDPVNSPICYCDFFNYAQDRFGHTLEPKVATLSSKIANPCQKTHLPISRKRDRTSLQAIYEGTNGQNWTNNVGWMNRTLDHCQWYGISCDDEGFVTSIHLRDNNLVGQFPVYTHSYDWPESGQWANTKYGLAKLRKLMMLDLADNKLIGTIDSRALYNLYLLTHFDVSGNQLSGEVNALVTRSLTHADFSNNHFTSMHRFEKYKPSFQTLQYCDVSKNLIKTDATDILDKIPTNIVQFIASNNQFYGSLPESLNNLPKLRQFNMSSNSLSGSLPESLNNLPLLRLFDMSSNALSGELPEFAGSISSLQELDLSKQRNGFTGSIPEDIWGFQFLRIMNLAGNKLAGTIPPVAISSLVILNLTDNELEGIIPPSIGNMVLLRVFDLSGNSLSGQIPFQIGQLDGKLKRLDLSNNALSGTIPSQLGQLQGASILLKDNLFDKKTAPLSLCLRDVEDFDLAYDPTFCQIERNALVEFYDAAKGEEWKDRSLWLDEDASYCGWKGVTCNQKGNITKLNLSNNGLSGRLSKRIGNFHFIEELDLSDNDIKGSIPAEIGLLSNLTYLHLSSNSFTGSIPEELGLGVGRNQSLKTMNLADNELTGSIPEDLGRFRFLTILNLSGNKLAGTIPPTIGDMAMLEALELSSNSLSGQIPFPIGQLGGVLKSLDLASNGLTGIIPSQLGQLQNASILLGGNHFHNSAKTAPLSLCMLRRVEAFDLAHDATFCPIERNALSDFYDSANGTGWANGTLWLDEYTSYCDWTGVTCEQDRHVTKLNLTNNGLSGRLSESIGNLTFIEVLDLSSNEIKESIPTQIGLLSKLTHLRLSSNAFTGTIPEDLGRFLKTMNLAGNKLTGSIPEDLGRFQSLKIMNLAGNKMSNSIPPTIGDMTVLEVLELSSNSLTGQIPFQIGQLEGTLKRLDLSNNTLSGTIPSQIGQLQEASILLRDNIFDKKTAPLSLCMLHHIGVEAEAFDLARDMTFCPIERNALSDFYDSAKGAEWTDRTNWLDGDEYASYCNWTGVTCNERNRVTKLNLANNGLSGRLSESIGNLTFIEVLDLSDNDIKGSIPAQIGNLTNLTYLRLSYNAFTGAAPVGLGKLKQLQLLQLQTNRITKIPNIPQLDDSIYNNSTFVSDCGVPTAFEEALECEHCTMCCNANEDCYPQEDTLIAEYLDLNYSTFAAVLIACFVALCCIVALSLYLFSKRKNRENAITMATEKRLEEDDKYALSRIGNESVYSYFVTDKVLGWIVAFATLGIQIGLLFVFVVASEVKLQDDKIDIQFTWKCPRDSDVCKNTADLAEAGWFIFAMLMIANLAKDMISGSKLIYHSSKVRHPLGSRIRYFIGGTLLCSITLFALYVSIIYNKAIATSNTEIIVNSVIVLFVMDLDEWIFAALEACKEKWTAHAADAEDSSADTKAEKGGVGVIDEMKDKIALQDAQIADQQKELMRQKIQIEQMARRFGETELQDGVQNMQDSQAGSSASFETVFYCDPNANAASSTSNADAVESEDAQFADARESGKMTM